ELDTQRAAVRELITSMDSTVPGNSTVRAGHPRTVSKHQASSSRRCGRAKMCTLSPGSALAALLAGGGQSHPLSVAIRSALARLRAESLAIAALILLRIVPSDRWRSAAISGMVAPLAVARSTSRSRGVSGLGPVLRAAAAKPGSMTFWPFAQ